MFNKIPITESEVAWADVILVIEEEQRLELAKRFPKYYLQKQIISLDIPDTYSYGQPELIAILKFKVQDLLEPLVK